MNTTLKIGNNLGAIILSVALEYVTKENDLDKAIKFLTTSIENIDTDITLSLIKGEKVFEVDEDSQSLILINRIPEIHDKLYPKIDIDAYFYKIKNNTIRDGNNFIIDLKIFHKSFKHKSDYLEKSLLFVGLLNLVMSDNVIQDNNIIEKYYNDTLYKDAFNCFKNIKKFIEDTLKALSLMKWITENFNECKDEKLYNNYISSRETITYILIEILKLLENFNQNMYKEPYMYSIYEYIRQINKINENYAKIKDLNIECNNIEYYDYPLFSFLTGRLSPNGDFYSLSGNYAQWIHKRIADDLLDKGIIPKENIINNNPDLWLEQNGWVKITENHIQFVGHLNHIYNKKDVFMTSTQIEKICNYCSKYYTRTIKLGWKKIEISIENFKYLVKNNPNELYEKYLS